MNNIDIQDIDFNLIKAFDALMKTRSVTKAASSLGIGQPAMSHALSRLRDTFNDELFVRSTIGMRPTQRAIQVAAPVQRALSEIRTAIQDSIVFDPETEEFEFTVALSDYSECVLLPELMADVAATAPNFRLKVLQYGYFSYRRLLEEKNVDLVVASVRREIPGYEHEHLFDDRRQCIYSRKLIDIDPPISLKEYLSYRHIGVDRDGDESSPVDIGLSRLGKTRTKALITPRFATLAPMLLRAPLIVTLPTRIARIFRHETDLVVSDLPFEVPSIEQSMIWHSHSSSAPAFVWLQQRIRASASLPLTDT